MEHDDKKYMAEGDARTLMDAERIKKDATRLAAAMECMEEMKSSMEGIKQPKSIEDIKMRTKESLEKSEKEKEK